MEYLYISWALQKLIYIYTIYLCCMNKDAMAEWHISILKRSTVHEVYVYQVPNSVQCVQ